MGQNMGYGRNRKVVPSEPLHNSRLGTSRYKINCSKEHGSILIFAVAYRIPNKVRLDNLKPNAVF